MYLVEIKIQEIKIPLTDTNINVYPVSISSQNNINDYKPTLLNGNEYNRVIKKIQENTIGITF